METTPSGWEVTATSRSGWAKGSGSNSTASRTVKMAVEAPMPSVSARMAVTLGFP
jgi:hypothetical protein